MKSIFLFILISFGLLQISSCCTKKGCVTVQNAPSIYLTFSGYILGYNELDYIRPFLYSNINDTLIDSAIYSYPEILQLIAIQIYSSIFLI